MIPFRLRVVLALALLPPSSGSAAVITAPSAGAAPAPVFAPPASLSPGQDLLPNMGSFSEPALGAVGSLGAPLPIFSAPAALEAPALLGLPALAPLPSLSAAVPAERLHPREALGFSAAGAYWTSPAAAPSGENEGEALPPARAALEEALRPVGAQGAVFDGSVLRAAPEGVSLPADSASPAPSQAEVAERAVFEIQKDAQGLFAGLDAIHSSEKRADPPADPAALLQLKREFLARLDSSLRAVPVDLESTDFPAARGRLEDARAARAALVRETREAIRARRVEIFPALGLRAAQLNRTVLTAQLEVARLLLLGHSSLRAKALRRNAALWTLAGAAHSAAAERAEWRYLASRARIRRVFRTDGDAVTIRRVRWRNARTMLEGAARDARNGREAAARAKAEFLARLYDSRGGDGGDLSGRYREISSRLRGALERSDPAELSRDLLAAASGITHPKISAAELVAYRDPDAARRSQDHALDSNRREFELILRHAATLELLTDALSGPALSAADRGELEADLRLLLEWAERGSVRPKQLAAQHLESALAGLEAGDSALARRYALLALAQLRERLTDLERISSALQNSPLP